MNKKSKKKKLNKSDVKKIIITFLGMYFMPLLINRIFIIISDLIWGKNLIVEIIAALLGSALGTVIFMNWERIRWYIFTDRYWVCDYCKDLFKEPVYKTLHLSGSKKKWKIKTCPCCNIGHPERFFGDPVMHKLTNTI